MNRQGRFRHFRPHGKAAGQIRAGRIDRGKGPCRGGHRGLSGKTNAASHAGFEFEQSFRNRVCILSYYWKKKKSSRNLFLAFTPFSPFSGVCWFQRSVPFEGQKTITKACAGRSPVLINPTIF